MSDTVILLFSKAPIPGQVKTRLIPKIGAADAAKVHQVLLEKVLETTLSFPEGTVQLWIANEPKHDFIEQLKKVSGVEVYQQQGRDLGERMFHAVERAYSSAKYLILIGGDCLSVSSDYIQQAVNQMKAGFTDVVIGPAEDGGYVLMGLACKNKLSDVAGLFSAVEWGSVNVFSQTRRKAEQQGLSMGLLDIRWDVDYWEDVERAVELGLLPPIDQIMKR